MYQQWITLFEHLDDDEYDGSMGLQDDEDPRILVHFSLQQSAQLRSNRSHLSSLNKQRVSSPPSQANNQLTSQSKKSSSSGAPEVALSEQFVSNLNLAGSETPNSSIEVSGFFAQTPDRPQIRQPNRLQAASVVVPAPHSQQAKENRPQPRMKSPIA